MYYDLGKEQTSEQKMVLMKVKVGGSPMSLFSAHWSKTLVQQPKLSPFWKLRATNDT